MYGMNIKRIICFINIQHFENKTLLCKEYENAVINIIIENLKQIGMYNKLGFGDSDEKNNIKYERKIKLYIIIFNYIFDNFNI